MPPLPPPSPGGERGFTPTRPPPSPSDPPSSSPSSLTTTQRPSQEERIRQGVLERSETVADAAPGNIHSETRGTRKGLPLSHPDDALHLTDLVCLVRKQVEIIVAVAPPPPPKKGKEKKRAAKNGSADAVGSDDGENGPINEDGGDGFGDGDSGKRDESVGMYASGKVGIRCIHCAPPDGVSDSSIPCGAKRGRRRKNVGTVTVGGIADEGLRGSPPTASNDVGDSVGGVKEGLRRRARGAVTYPTSVRLVYQAVRNWQRHHLMACPSIPTEVKAEYTKLREATCQRRSGNESSRYWERGCAMMGLVDVPTPEQNKAGVAGGGTVLRMRKEAWEGTWTEAMGLEAVKNVLGEDPPLVSPTPSLSPSASFSSTKKPRKRQGKARRPRSIAANAIPCAAVVSSPSSPIDEAGAVIPGKVPLDQAKMNSSIKGGGNSRLPEEHSSSVAFPRKVNGGSAATTRPNPSAQRADNAEVNARSSGRVGAGGISHIQLDKNSSAAKSPPRKASDSGATMARPSPSIRLSDNKGADCGGQFQEETTIQQNKHVTTNGNSLLALSGHSDATREGTSPLAATTGSAKCGTNIVIRDDSDSYSHSAPDAGKGLDTSLFIRPPQSPLNSDPQLSAPSCVETLTLPSQLSHRKNGTDGCSPLSLKCREAPSWATPMVANPDGGIGVGDLCNTPQPWEFIKSATAMTIGEKEKMAEVPRVRNHQGSQSTVMAACQSKQGGSVINPQPVLSSTDCVVGKKINRERNGAHSRRESASATGLGSVSVASRAGLLERVALARCAVNAVGGIRELPSHTVEVNFQRKQGSGQDLSYLGLELYELFSGQSVGEGDVGSGRSGNGELRLSDAEEFGDASWPRRRKREKRPEHQRYVPLRERGLPPSLCYLVSSLLDGGGDYCSVEDVEEDLRLIETEPEMFLFNPPTGDIQTGTTTAVFGRAREKEKMLKVYERAVDMRVQASNVVLVSGYAGTGKSSLVRTMQGCFVERGAHFISGKFDVMQQMQPLSVIASALNDYCSLLSQETGRICQVREAVAAAVGSEAQVLANLIPNLCKVIHVPDDRPSTQVSGREALQRLAFLFRVLLRATCSHSHPVVLFLDDLQWADEVSLELMHSLAVDSQTRGLLFIGAYRDSDVGSDHPLLMHLSNIQKSDDVDVTSIHVGNLDTADVNSLVANILQMLPRMTRPLARSVRYKTGGNAMFVIQFLVSLQDEGLLRFCLLTKQWQWDIEAINTKDIADNVVGLMTAKILRLAPAVHHALMVAASLGPQCHEDVLGIVETRAPEKAMDIVAALDVAVSEGLMVKSESKYRFSHDQIQSAAYILIPESAREAFHLRLGRLLWQNSSAEELERHLFVVVEQMNRGSCLISNHDEKVNLARLCLMAGQKAVAISAFLPASVYFKAGIRLTVDGDWEIHRKLCLDLHDSCAEMEFILGRRFEDINSHVNEVMQRGRSLQDKMRAYSTLIQSMGAQGNKNDAVSTAIAVLGCLGESFDSVASQAAVQQDLMKTQKLIGTKLQDSLSEMKDANKKDAMKFLDLALLYDFASNKAYFPLFACRMVQLSLLYGLTRESAVGFAVYGFLVSVILNDRDTGSRFGKLALTMLEKFDTKENHARVYCTVYGYIANWTEPMQASLPCLKHAVDLGLLTGDTEYAAMDAHLYTGTALHSGYPLEKLVEEMKGYSKQMLENNQTFIHTLNAPVRQTSLNLLGRSANPVKLVGEEMDEDSLLRSAENSGELIYSMIHLFRMWLAYLFKEYELAAEMIEKNRDHYGKETELARFDPVCAYAFYSGLTALVLARKEGKSKWIGTIEKATGRMEVLTASCAWNCQHKLDLMKAEFAYLEGNNSEAAGLYASSMELAAKHRFIHDRALALELAGIFYLENGNNIAASGLLKEAYDCYTKWGAHSKAAHLKEHHYL